MYWKRLGIALSVPKCYTSKNLEQVGVPHFFIKCKKIGAEKMKTEFAVAITQLSAERNLPKEEVLTALESALALAYKKDISPPDQDILVKVNPDDGKVRVYIRKTVVAAVTNPNQEISWDEARKLRSTAQVGDTIEIESPTASAGRITIQSAKQAILQRLREAEHRTTYGEFIGREAEIVTGLIQFIEHNQLYVRLNRTEAILPLSEQMASDHYYKGQRLKFYLLKVARSAKGPQVIVSRSHPYLMRRLFELEIPEVRSGIVEIKAIAREAGQRSKVAVATNQQGVDAVGCCLGPRGIRLQSIINELNGEKIDIIQWHPDPDVFVVNALSPAQVAGIKINEAGKTATVIVPDKQLSLAIGKDGQNARLAARLTGWRIDIKSVSTAQAEKILQQTALEELVTEEVSLPSSPPNEPVLPQPIAGKEASQTIFPALETTRSRDEAVLVSTASGGKAEKKQIRFAEDILPTLSNVEKQAKGGKLEKEKVKGKRYRKPTFHPEGEGYEE